MATIRTEFCFGHVAWRLIERDERGGFVADHGPSHPPKGRYDAQLRAIDPPDYATYSETFDRAGYDDARR